MNVLDLQQTNIGWQLKFPKIFPKDLITYVFIGGIQYYSFKPIAMGQELLVFYGDGYFEELGYSLETDNNSGQCYICYV